jgi:hypothetical protein
MRKLVFVGLLAVVLIAPTAATAGFWTRAPSSAHVSGCRVWVGHPSYTYDSLGQRTAVVVTTSLNCDQKRNIGTLSAALYINVSHHRDSVLGRVLRGNFTAKPGKTYLTTYRATCPVTGQMYYGTGFLDVKGGGSKTVQGQTADDRYMWCQQPVHGSTPTSSMGGGA